MQKWYDITIVTENSTLRTITFGIGGQGKREITHMTKKPIIALALTSAFTIGTIGTALSPITASANGPDTVQETKYGYETQKQFDKKFKGKDKESADSESILEAGILKQFKSKFASVDGNQIHYKIYEGKKNAKKTFVVVHGATATMETTKIYAGALATENPDARVLIVDLPLHGQSTSDSFTTADISVENYAKIMKQFLDQKRADGTITGVLNYSGWSMGGSIGLQLDLMGAGIDELVLVNSSPVWETIPSIGNLFGLEQFNADAVAAMMPGSYSGELTYNISEKDSADLISNIDKFIADTTVGAADFNTLYPENYDLRDQLGNIKAKTLIISGTKDVIAEPRFQTFMDEQIPNSELVMYEDAHSMFMKPQIAEQMADEITEYFGKAKGNGKGNGQGKGKGLNK